MESKQKPTYQELENQVVGLNVEYDLLLKKENEYKLLFDSMTEMISTIELIYNTQGKPIDFYLREINKPFEHFLGKPKSQIINRKATVVIGPIEDYWLEASANVEKTGKPTQIENYGVALNKYYSVNIWKISKTKLGVSFTDITEQKKTETKISEAKEKAEAGKAFLNNIINNIGDHVYVKDDQSRFLIVNDAFCESFGMVRANIIGKTLAENVDPDERDRFLKMDQQILNNGLENISEQNITINGRQTQIVSTRKTRFINSKGEKLLICIAREITEQKKDEKNKAEAKIVLEQTEKELNEAQKLAGIGSWLFDPITQKAEWSDGMFRIWGFDKEKGTPKYEPAIVNRIDMNHIELFKKVVAKATDSGAPYDIEFQINLPNEKQKMIRAICEVEIDDNGSIIGLSGTSQDITKQKEIEKQMIEAKEKAEESDRLKSAFLANMSHEIRTPMNGILGFAELLSDSKTSQKEIKEYTNIIQVSGTRMLNTINDIIDISKIESGLMTVHLESSNINKQIDFLTTFFKPQIKAKGLLFKTVCTLSKQNAILYCDREKIYSILTNLTKNAIKNTSSGGIEIGYAKKDDFIEFYVKDTGIGIAKKAQKEIFDRFIQIENFDKKVVQGTGLGLAISKAYAKMLGGNLWVESTVNVGSTFFFTIPYLKFSDVDELPSSNNGIIDSNKKGLKILVVDDDEISNQLLSIVLQKKNHIVIQTTNGQEAVDICRDNNEIDIILMDIRMPILNGYEACKEIRLFNTEVIIIAQTAFGLKGDQEKAISAGCNGYLTKPIDHDKLHEKIESYTKN